MGRGGGGGALGARGRCRAARRCRASGRAWGDRRPGDRMADTGALPAPPSRRAAARAARPRRSERPQGPGPARRPSGLRRAHRGAGRQRSGAGAGRPPDGPAQGGAPRRARLDGQAGGAPPRARRVVVGRCGAGAARFRRQLCGPPGGQLAALRRGGPALVGAGPDDQPRDVEQRAAVSRGGRAARRPAPVRDAVAALVGSLAPRRFRRGADRPGARGRGPGGRGAAGGRRPGARARDRRVARDAVLRQGPALRRGGAGRSVLRPQREPRRPPGHRQPARRVRRPLRGAPGRGRSRRLRPGRGRGRGGGGCPANTLLWRAHRSPGPGRAAAARRGASASNTPTARPGWRGPRRYSTPSATTTSFGPGCASTAAASARAWTTTAVWSRCRGRSPTRATGCGVWPGIARNSTGTGVRAATG